MARQNHYEGLSADYSKLDPVSEPLRSQLIDEGLRFAAMKEAVLPAINTHYPAEQIEQENKAWLPTHCEALRQGRGDILVAEYRDDLVYFCQDGPYYRVSEQKVRESTGGH